MKVHVRVPTVLRQLCDGQSVLDIELADAATVADLLDHLAGAHPALERRVRDEQGRLRTHVNVFLGDENVRALEDTATVLRDGAEVSIIAAISGG